ncbi:hypothetical protein ACK3SF_04815 [Candidatus Nanosalina sp. VS9-1]|uniref:hypothetical protein n=1 Tax=Candidatus Nanosalina sp. VS9-1 TaxID=3388566 RepID=UPI0039E0C1A7
MTYLLITSAALYFALGIPSFVSSYVGTIALGFLSMGAFSLNLAYSGGHSSESKKKFQIASVSLIVAGVILTHHIILFALKSRQFSGLIGSLLSLNSVIPDFIFVNRILGSILLFSSFYFLFGAIEESNLILERDIEKITEKIGRKIALDESMIEEGHRFGEAD